MANILKHTLNINNIDPSLLCFNTHIEVKHFKNVKFSKSFKERLKNRLILHTEHYDKNVLLSRIYLVSFRNFSNVK